MKRDQNYLKALIEQFWIYVDTVYPERLFLLETAQRDLHRPPVFREGEETHNILFPPGIGNEQKSAIAATIPVKERHRWFRSMKSSQAVAQSVFGNLIVAGKLTLLEGLESDDGSPAFCQGMDSASAQLEYSVSYLGEPRPTSVDVWFAGPYRIAVECKLTELDFGTCSRPRLKEGKDSNYERDFCDGSYSRQRNRQSRCSLTEVGVRYWDYIPEILGWEATNDLDPCPLRNTYQLVRNVLAACVTADGHIDVDNAHALIIYDARNPSFQMDGIANNQWKAARAALEDAGLLRSCSWQSLVGHLESSGEVEWLVDQLRLKYGF